MSASSPLHPVPDLKNAYLLKHSRLSSHSAKRSQGWDTLTQNIQLHFSNKRQISNGDGAHKCPGILLMYCQLQSAVIEGKQLFVRLRPLDELRVHLGSHVTFHRYLFPIGCVQNVRGSYEFEHLHTRLGVVETDAVCRLTFVPSPFLSCGVEKL